MPDMATAPTASPQSPSSTMATSPLEEPPPTSITSLNPEILQHIFMLEELTIKDVLNCRQACSCFRSNGAQVINGIRSINGELMPGIFTTFPNSTAVKLILDFKEGLSMKQLAASLVAFGHALPEGLESFSVRIRHPRLPRGLKGEAGQQLLLALEEFCGTLHLLPWAKTLKTMHMFHSTGLGAVRLLQALSSATDVRLHVFSTYERVWQSDFEYGSECDSKCGTSGGTSSDSDSESEELQTIVPSFPPSLERLELQMDRVKVDMANLARCSKLRHLLLDDSRGVNMQKADTRPLIFNLCRGLAGCSSLAYLDVEWLRCLAGKQASAASPPLPDSLQRLTHMRGPETIVTSSPLWHSISRLRQLARLEVKEVYVDSTAARLTASHTSLSIVSWT